MTRPEVAVHLGRPDFTMLNDGTKLEPDRYRYGDIWIYGDMYFYFSRQANRRLNTIAPYLDRYFGQCEAPMGGAAFQLDPWLLYAGAERQQIELALTAQDIQFQSQEVYDWNHFCWRVALHLVSGITLVFVERPINLAILKAGRPGLQRATAQAISKTSSA